MISSSALKIEDFLLMLADNVLQIVTLRLDDLIAHWFYVIDKC